MIIITKRYGKEKLNACHNCDYISILKQLTCIVKTIINL